MRREQFLHERQRFSIRKYSFGAASVLLGASLVFAGQALAEEQATPASSSSVVVATSSSTDTLAVSDASSTEASTPVASSQASDSQVMSEVASSVAQSEQASSEVGSTQTSEASSEEASQANASTTTTTASEVATTTLDLSRGDQVDTLDEAALLRASLATSLVSVPASTDRTTSENALPSQGYYVYKERTEVKSEPKLEAKVQFYAEAGSRVYYDQVVTADGYQWISYKSYSGVRRYAPVEPAVSGSGSPDDEKLINNNASTGALSLPANGTFTFTRDTKIKTAPEADLKPTYVFGKGDHVIYDKVLEADGHQWISYIGYDFARYYADIATLTSSSTATSTGVQTGGDSGTYQVTRTLEVKNEPKTSAKTEFTLEKGYNLNYDKVVTADNHQWLSYVSFSGQRRYVDIATLTAKDAKPTGDISIQNQDNGDFNVIISNVTDGNGVKEVKVPVWTVKNDQDDIIWYSADKQNDGTYKVAVKLSDHKNERGDYNVHLYYVENSGKMVGVSGTKTTVAEPKEKRISGQIAIENKTSDGFDVVISDVSGGGKSIQEVQVPVWSSKDGQDDLAWNRAEKQADGTYKTHVAVQDHKSDHGEYFVHLYYVIDGHQVGVSGTTTTVPEVTTKPDTTGDQSVTGVIELPATGTYHFKKTADVKSEPKVSAKTEFTFENGDSVAYDKVLTEDNHQWLSYVSFSGQRRYVDIATLKTTENKPTEEVKPATDNTKVSGKINISNMSATGFDVTITDVSGAGKTIQEVQVPVWSTKNGQDDLTWNRAEKQADGTYKTHVAVSEHKGDTGDYFVHLYYVIDGHQVGVSGTSTKVPEPTKPTGDIAIQNKDNGDFDVIISNVVDGKGVQKVQVPIWTVKNDQDDIIWYTADKQADGTYKVAVKLSDHKNERGTYNVHLYYVENDGKMTGVTGIQTTVAQSKENRVSGKINISNMTSTGFDVTITDVSGGGKAIQEVQVPVWSDKNGQDDLAWNRAEKQADGTYKTHVAVSDHKGDTGNYFVHLYYVIDGHQVGVSGTTTKVPEAKAAVTGAEDIPESGTYHFTKTVDVKNEAKVSAKTEFNFNSGESVYYDKVLTADNHQWISYVSRSGIRRYVDIATLATTPSKPTGDIAVTKTTASGFDVLISNVSDSQGVKDVKVPIWTVKNDQDDIIWYTADKQTDGNYKVAVKWSDHKNEQGDYNIHLYYVENDGNLKGVGGIKTTLKAPDGNQVTGDIHIENKTADGFDVVITNVSDPNGIKGVKVPTWSTRNDQDDIIWYDATKQSNGDYKVSVKTSDHKNDRGLYNVHLYYVENNGSLKGVGGVQTTVETSQDKVRYNGSYYSVDGKYGEIVLANKKHPMSANYNPGEDPTAKAAFTKLRDDMIAQGYNVGRAYSGFRTYEYQKTLYDNYVNRDGQAQADRYSARPGYSEHQTGLVFDLTDKSGNLLEDARATQWLKDHAHEYGFIVRYQAGKEASTGYMPEAWHIRYLGQEAKDVHDSGLSLEEYLGVEGGDYKDSAPADQSSNSTLPASGHYTFTKRSGIKAEAKVTSPDIAYYGVGDSVNYDKTVTADGHNWISYLSYSGHRRYIAID